MKFNLMGIVAPIEKDPPPPPPPEFVPSPVRSGSAARITFQLHAHTYTSSVKLHYNTTKTQTTTTMIFVSQYILQLLGCSGGGGGGGQPQISKSVVLHTKDYGISMGVLSSFFHSPPTSSTRLFFFGARLLRPRGRPELGTGGATSSSSSLEPAASSSVSSLEDSGPASSHSSLEDSAPVASSASSSQSGSVTAFTSGPSSTCGKKNLIF